MPSRTIATTSSAVATGLRMNGADRLTATFPAWLGEMFCT